MHCAAQCGCGRYHASSPGWEDSCHTHSVPVTAPSRGKRLISSGASGAGPPKGSPSIQHGPRLCFGSSPLPSARPRGSGLCQEPNGFSLAAGWPGSAKRRAGDPEGKSKVRTRESGKQTQPEEEEQGKKRSCRTADQLAGTCETWARSILPKPWGCKLQVNQREKKAPLFGHKRSWLQ